jgi:hypothetical protein
MTLRQYKIENRTTDCSFSHFLLFENFIGLEVDENREVLL